MFHKALRKDVSALRRILLVSDIHGQFEALQDALDAAGYSPSRDAIWVLGDMVDRGPDSSLVVAWVREHAAVALCGNHEDMWLQATDHPGLDSLYNVVNNGGRATFQSFRQASARSLDEAIAWFRTLPTRHRTSVLAVVHGGFRPGVPWDRQTREDQLWIREDWFTRPPEPSIGVPVVFGHTPTQFLPQGQWGRVWHDPDRLGIDTGAGMGGVVSLVDPVAGQVFPSQDQPYRVPPLVRLSSEKRRTGHDSEQAGTAQSGLRGDP